MMDTFIGEMRTKPHRRAVPANDCGKVFFFNDY